MKLLIITTLLALAYQATADVSHLQEAAQILKQELDVGPDGSYQWAYETSNGIAAQQQGQLKNGPDPENPIQSVVGQAQWTSPEGENIQLQYTADENGYQPQGSHIPTSPPIPEAILRSLEYIAAHPQKQQP